MKVSIVMAVRDGVAHLPAAFDSVLAQTLRDWELVIVDDGSTDGTAAWLEERARQDARMRVIHQAGAGQGSARLRALRWCRGEYIANLDADDAMLPHRLEFQVRFLDCHPEIGLLGSAAELIDQRGQAYCTYILPTSDAELRQLLKQDNPFFHSAMMFRADILARAGAYDRSFTVAEDYDLWLRLAQHCRIATLPAPLIQYRTHAQSVSRIRRRAGAREVLSIHWRAVHRGWHKPWALVFSLRHVFYLVAPQAVMTLVYWRRRRLNRGTVVRTASWFPRLKRL
jgi:glycosyltransferase involved in cell wall biosynthesis